MEDINQFLSWFKYPHRHPFSRNPSDSFINSHTKSDSMSRSLHQEIAHLMPSSERFTREGDGNSSGSNAPGVKIESSCSLGVEYPRRCGQIRSRGEISHPSCSPINVDDQHNIQEYSDIHEVRWRHARRSHVKGHPSTPTRLTASRLLASHVEPPSRSSVRRARPNSRMRRAFQETGLESDSQMATSVADDDDKDGTLMRVLCRGEPNKRGQLNGLRAAKAGCSLADTSDSRVLSRTPRSHSLEWIINHLVPISTRWTRCRKVAAEP